MPENNLDPNYTLLFSPASNEDFWKAKSLLKEISVPYKVQASIYNSQYVGWPRTELHNRTEILVLKKDFGSATLACKEFINRAEEQEEYWKNYKPTLIEKVKRFFKIV